MWGEPPPGNSVAVRWVTDDRLLDRVEHPHGAPDLLCEECEERDALVYSELDKEALCAKCCRLLYPRKTTGKPHSAFSEQKVREVARGDKSRALRPHSTAEHWEDIISEDR